MTQGANVPPLHTALQLNLQVTDSGRYSNCGHKAPCLCSHVLASVAASCRQV